MRLSPRRKKILNKSLIAFVTFLFVTQNLTVVTLGQNKYKAEENPERPKRTEIMEQPSLNPILDGPIDPDKYVLGPSDELILIIRGSKTERMMLRVLPEGTVILPNIGSFKAVGLSLSEFRKRLRVALKRFYRNIDIDVELSTPRTFMVNVLGEVRNPGPVVLKAPFRIIKAIELAGGVSKAGSLRRIEVRANASLVRRIDLFSFMHMGKITENLILSEGQTVFVPVRKNLAYSSGQLMEPGIFEVLPGETLADLIRFSGGFNSNADSMRIVLERFEENTNIITRVLSVDQCRSIEVKDRDRIMVPDIMSFPGSSFIRVMGGGGRTGVFYIFPGEKLKDFLLRVGHFAKDFDLSKAVLERKKGNGESEHIYLNVAGILKGDDKSGDIVLKDQDILGIQSLESKVYVIGEVQEPGAVPFNPNFTAAKYVSLAGGTTEAGDIDKVSIISANGKTRRAGRMSVVFRGETIVVKKSTSKILGGFFLGLASMTGLLISIIAITK